MRPNAAGTTFLDLVLYPNRSLPVRGCWVLLAVAAGLSGLVAYWFAALGAWPVAAFSGFDVLLLAVCLRRNYRDGRMFEQVRLTSRELTVARVDPSGEAQHWSFEPTWLRVVLEDEPPMSNRLTLASHGRQIRIGAFLAPQERSELAVEIQAGLDRRRRALMR